MLQGTKKAFQMATDILKREGFAVDAIWGVMPGLDNRGGYEDFLCVMADGTLTTIRVHVQEGNKRTHDYWTGWVDQPSQTKKELKHA